MGVYICDLVLLFEVLRGIRTRDIEAYKGAIARQIAAEFYCSSWLRAPTSPTVRRSSAVIRNFGSLLERANGRFEAVPFSGLAEIWNRIDWIPAAKSGVDPRVHAVVRGRNLRA